MIRARRFLLKAAVTPERIVVGQQQLRLRLDEVGAEQQSVVRAERPRGSRRGTRAQAGGSKLPMLEPRKRTSIAPRPRCDGRVRASPPRRSSGGRRSRRARSGSAVRSDCSSAVWRDVDQVDRRRCGLRLAERLGEHGNLLAAAAAELDETSAGPPAARPPATPTARAAAPRPA